MDDLVQTLSTSLECMICLEVLTTPQRTRCNHVFCKSCIQRYLKINTTECKCPLCKTPISKRGLNSCPVLQELINQTKETIRAIRKDVEEISEDYIAMSPSLFPPTQQSLASQLRMSKACKEKKRLRFKKKSMLPSSPPSIHRNQSIQKPSILNVRSESPKSSPTHSTGLQSSVLMGSTQDTSFEKCFEKAEMSFSSNRRRVSGTMELFNSYEDDDDDEDDEMDGNNIDNPMKGEIGGIDDPQNQTSTVSTCNPQQHEPTESTTTTSSSPSSLKHHSNAINTCSLAQSETVDLGVFNSLPTQPANLIQIHTTEEVYSNSNHSHASSSAAEQLPNENKTEENPAKKSRMGPVGDTPKTPDSIRVERRNNESETMMSKSDGLDGPDVPDEPHHHHHHHATTASPLFELDENCDEENKSPTESINKEEKEKEKIALGKSTSELLALIHHHAQPSTSSSVFQQMQTMDEEDDEDDDKTIASNVGRCKDEDMNGKNHIHSQHLHRTGCDSAEIGFSQDAYNAETLFVDNEEGSDDEEQEIKVGAEEDRDDCDGKYKVPSRSDAKKQQHQDVTCLANEPTTPSTTIENATIDANKQPLASCMLLFSGFPREIEEKYELLGKKLGAQILDTFTPDVTHIIGHFNDSLQLKSNTVKTMMGIALGKWIICPAWIQACSDHGVRVDEEFYEMQGLEQQEDNQPESRNGAQLSRISKKRILEGYQIAIIGKFATETLREEFQQLASYAGATIVSMVEARKQCVNGRRKTIIIIDNENIEDETLDQVVDVPNQCILDFYWLLDTITMHQIQNTSSFELEDE
eukprot:m.62881 g.62881  ORF g.62881 m.62881 type:complete len:809 (-) comp8046_c0_seq1:111-2537(-)